MFDTGSDSEAELVGTGGMGGDEGNRIGGKERKLTLYDIYLLCLLYTSDAADEMD